MFHNLNSVDDLVVDGLSELGEYLDEGVESAVDLDILGLLWLLFVDIDCSYHAGLL